MPVVANTSSHGDKQSENKRALIAHSLCFPPLPQRQPFESSGLRMITTPLCARGHLPTRLLALPGIPDLPRLHPYLLRLTYCNEATRLVSPIIWSFPRSQPARQRRGLSIPAQAHRQKFLEGRGTGRENLFPKRFPSPQAFPPKQKIPGWYRGRSRARHHGAPQGEEHKKRPPRAESCKGASNNLWQRPTFPHDVMQYHRRWRA